MCSGRIDPAFILKALATKADAVVVSGCHIGDCHYQNGNLKHLRRMKILKRMLSQLGLEPERLQMFWISAAESKEFQETMIKVVNDIKELGPNPLLKTAPMVIPVE
jgi:F420-non-reducing hydrogenase iron-sulfur subunit